MKNRLILPLSEEFIYASPEYVNRVCYRLLMREEMKLLDYPKNNRKEAVRHVKKPT
ncbi:hypothetical protein [Solemya velesiana gill symbiont]|uniref:hypothetical protein n=1 Tax=Solemya velesiana gill symbiont TaxID=1918948 RepID=UPI001560A3D3|nr:hypothetical protein [Solemya velesiana gill symbiont]